MSEQINVIFDERKSNPELVSVSFGKKKTEGAYTGEDAIVFTVLKKKALNELPPEDVIPAVVEVDGKLYKTDVEEGLKAIPMNLPEPDPLDPFDDWRRGVAIVNKNQTRPIQGGVAIEDISQGWIGTMGVLCKDNDTGAMCLLSNVHVLADDPLKVSERSMADIPCYDSQLITQGGGSSLSISVVGRKYKLKGLSATYNNIADCAIATIKSDTLNLISLSTSRRQCNMTFTNVTKFASTAELNALGFGDRVYSSGSRTGAKGEIRTLPAPDGRNMVTKLYIDSANVSVSVGPYTRRGNVVFNAYFTNCISIFASDTDQFGENKYGCTIPGDSGSVVFADFYGIPKIIGLVFAGNGYTGYVCRIDNVCAALNISQWEDDPVNPIQGEQLEYLDETNPEYLDVEGLDGDDFKVVGDKKYWNIGTLRK